MLLSLSLPLLAHLPSPVAAASAGSAFTYQGQLSLNGSAAPNGLYDFRFTPFDAPTLGSALTSAVQIPALGVTNGLFTVQLDFGSAPFSSGEARWLEVQVNTNGVSPLVLLEPRQRISLTPQAVFAVTATTASTASAVSPGSIASASILDGSISPLDLSPELLQETFWRISGNAGVGGGFLGTTDNQALELRVNNARAMHLRPAPGGPNVIAGDASNAAGASASGATIGGGTRNASQGNYTIVGGGIGNSLTVGFYSTIGGGSSNTVTAAHGFIGGGNSNLVGGFFATVGGGALNQAGEVGATVGGGSGNRAEGFHSAVLGGLGNQATESRSIVGAGALNRSEAELASIVGGRGNLNQGEAGFIGGGEANTNSGAWSVISGGVSNVVQAALASIHGGGFSTVEGSSSVGATIGGGLGHGILSSPGATISGGEQNSIQLSPSSTIGGGSDQSVFSAISSTIGGGIRNYIFTTASCTIGGGQKNVVGFNATDATIGGGGANWIVNSKASVIAGGNGNVITNFTDYSSIAGGLGNFINAGARGSTIGGGGRNAIQLGDSSVVGGGTSNEVRGSFSVIPGGAGNRALGSYAFAAGRRAQAGHLGSFVWADSQDEDFRSTATNQFSIRAQNGLVVDSSTTALEIRGGGALRVTGAGVNTATPIFTHRALAGNTAGAETRINHPYCNNKPSAILIVTYNFNPAGSAGVRNDRPVGIYYTGTAWAIYNLDGAAMPVGAAYNVMVANP